MTLDSILPPKAVPFSGVDPQTNAAQANVVKLANAASESLQKVQELLGRNHLESAKLRFPRGYLVEIGRWRLALPFVKRATVRSNVAYTLMMYDVQTWVLHRTDIGSTARDMLVKSSIASLGSIVEALIVDATSPPMGRNQRIKSRIKHLVSNIMLPESLAEELNWLWDTRNRQHLQELISSEFDFYDKEMLPRAEAAVVALIKALQHDCQQGTCRTFV